MLTGTTRDPADIVAVVPPDLVECTVEKVAINAVLAGCKPEYLPVVITAVVAACTDAFNIHGLLATTYFSSPVMIVNGPITKAIGMNAGINVLGQGNRANATIGRALQLVVRNVGGGRPGGVDRATLGNPGKYTFCFAEDEAGSPWEPLHVERGLAPDASAVTLFAGDGVRGMVDQLSREPDSLARSLAACLQAVPHRRWRSASTSSSWSRPSTGACSARAAGRRPACAPSCWSSSSSTATTWSVGRAASPRACPKGLRAPLCRSSATTASCSCTPAAAPGCSRPSLAAGSTGPAAASPSPGR
jgi:hypothetical protein